MDDFRVGLGAVDWLVVLQKACGLNREFRIVNGGFAGIENLE